MSIQQVIDLANGFGVVRFGWAMDDVESVLGRPDEAEFVDPETKMAAIWYYRLLRLQVAFFEYPVGVPVGHYLPLRAVSFLTDHESATLWGTKMVGLGKSRLLRLFDEHGYLGFSNCPDELTKFGHETTSMSITIGLHWARRYSRRHWSAAGIQHGWAKNESYVSH